MILGIAVLFASGQAGASDKDLCEGIDKDFLSKHVMFTFDRIVEKKPVTDYKMCMVIINVRAGVEPDINVVGLCSSVKATARLNFYFIHQCSRGG